MNLLLLASWLAQAHPVGADRTSHQVRLTLTGNEVVVDYGVWVPIRQLGRQAAQERLTELFRGLSLTANDKPLALEPQAMNTPPVTSQGHVVRFQMGLKAQLPSTMSTLDLVLYNPNEPEALSAFQNEIFLGREWQTQGSSLLLWQGDTLVENRQGQWRMDEESREIHLEAQRLPPWRTVGKSERFVPVAKALPPPAQAWILPGGLAVLVVVSMLLGKRRRIDPTP